MPNRTRSTQANKSRLRLGRCSPRSSTGNRRRGCGSFPAPKAQRAAELHELAVNMIEKKSRIAAARTPDANAAHRVAEKLTLARENLEHWRKLAADPKLSPRAALAARNHARSQQAAVALYEKAHAYESEKKAAALAEQNAPLNDQSAVEVTTTAQAAIILDKALTWFANAWIGLIAFLNLIAIIGFMVTAPTFWDGIAKVQEIHSPFNVWNLIAEVIALSPAVGAIAWRDRRLKRRAAPR